MKKLLLILIGLSLMALLFAGCGDDETTAPTRVRAALYTQGVAYLDSSYSNTVFSLESYIDFFSINADGYYVDSVDLSGNQTHVQTETYWNVYRDGYHYLTYNDTSDHRFQAGDTVEINLYYRNTMATCRIKLLDHTQSPNIIIPTHLDTSSLGSPINFIFNSSPHADWYAIQQRYWHDSAGSNVYSRTYWAQEDTAFTIPGADLIQNGRLDVYIIAGTGPMPGGTVGDNISGDLIDGVMFSNTMSKWTRIFIGTGVAGAPANDDIEDPAEMANQIMYKLTGIKPRPTTGSTDQPIY